MDRLARLVKQVYVSTKAGKTVWRPSSIIGGYITNFKRFKIEILKPGEMSLNLGRVDVISTLGSNLPYRSVSSNDWRMIIYDVNGNVRSQIGPSSLEDDDLKALNINFSKTQIFVEIHKNIKQFDRAKEADAIDEILEELSE